MSEAAIGQAIGDVGIGGSSTVLVHSSLRSLGRVDGGAGSVARALVATGATIVAPSGTWDRTGVRPPPGLSRPNNASTPAESWQDFERLLAAASPYASVLPIDKALGAIPEALRGSFDHLRGSHPLFSFLAIGPNAAPVIEAVRMDWPLGPIDVLDELDGQVLLIGVDHTANTTVHLAEQRLGRGRFFRYPKLDTGVWAELPNVLGESHRFGDFERFLAPFTVETRIGAAPVRLLRVRDILAAVTAAIEADPAIGLCDDDTCRCVAARRQHATAVR